MTPITPRQKEILRLIINSIEMHGYPPTIVEMMNAGGYRSHRGITNHLDQLELKGFIQREPFSGRGISVLKNEHGNTVCVLVVPVVEPGK